MPAAPRAVVSRAATVAYALAMLTLLASAAALYEYARAASVLSLAWGVSGLVSAAVFWILGRIAEDVHIIRQNLNR